MDLNAADRALIAAVQDGLPLVERPFAALAAELGSSEQDVLERMAHLQQEELIKRVGVVVRHRALGYRANAMVVWDVPEELLERTGKQLATEPRITLCYQRPRRLPEWPYNLFCMIHGMTREDVLRDLATMIGRHGLEDIPHAVLFSVRAFKQCGAHYVAAGTQEVVREVAHG